MCILNGGKKNPDSLKYEGMYLKLNRKQEGWKIEGTGEIAVERPDGVYSPDGPL